MLESTKRAAGPFLVKIPHKGEAGPGSLDSWHLDVPAWGQPVHGLGQGRHRLLSCCSGLVPTPGEPGRDALSVFVLSLSPAQLSVPVQQQELTRMEMEVFSSAPSLLGAASSLQRITGFLKNGLCHSCRELKDTVAVCSDSNWAKMPSERCVLCAKFFLVGLIQVYHRCFVCCSY